MAGLAQKGGAVWSHVRIADRPEQLHAARVAAGEANAVIGVTEEAPRNILRAVALGGILFFVVVMLMRGDGDLTAMLRGALAGQIIRRTADGASMGRITFSAGVSASHADDTPDSVIARADSALYTAKRLGRDRVIPDRN